MPQPNPRFRNQRKHRIFPVLLVFISLLAACSTTYQTDSEPSLYFESNAITGVAWGEQVQVNSTQIPASPPLSIQYQIGSGAIINLSPVHQQAGQVVFILPEMPALPTLSNFSSPYSITPSQYNSPLSSAQISQYSNRGIVKVTLTAGNKKIKRNYQPFGAVEPGELTVMAQSNNCSAFENAVTSLGFSKLDSASAGNLCYLTAGFSTIGTSQAINKVNSLDLSNLWVDKNVVQGLDPRGSSSFDPSCAQIETWLDLAGASGFDLLNPADILASSNASAAHNLNLTGAGVNVFVIGGGIGANDAFVCEDAQGNVLFQGHDSHIAEIIQLIAPDAHIEDRVVCNAAGHCPSSEIVRALIDVSQVAQQNSGKDLINMSLGGPTGNSVMQRVLEIIEPGITVIASSGNGPFAPSHYPAAYSSGALNPGSLDNIVAVAATGRLTGSWALAGFNTRNAELFAPGTNVCVQTATSFRCDPQAATTPENLGITGTSFAAPVATGMAALYLEHSNLNLSPSDLRSCLTSAALLNPNLNRMIWFDASICP